MQGTGPTNLLLHGYPSSSFDDFLGFGLWDRLRPHRCSLLEQADIVQTVVAECTTGAVGIIAHDMRNLGDHELVARDLACRASESVPVDGALHQCRQPKWSMSASLIRSCACGCRTLHYDRSGLRLAGAQSSDSAPPILSSIDGPEGLRRNSAGTAAASRSRLFVPLKFSLLSQLAPLPQTVTRQSSPRPPR